MSKISDERLEELRDRILKEREAGNIVFWGLPDELMAAKLDDFIKQPASGMLYDLNRLEEVVLTFLADPKWVNDFAVATVIRRLDADLRELQALRLASATGYDQSKRDFDWILAIGHALGLESGFEVPIVPEIEPFKRLFDAVRASATGRTAVPEGFVLVPREPTKEMIEAGQDEHDNCIDTGFSSNADGDRYEYTTISPDAPYRVFKAMLSAAPQAKREA